MNRKISATIKSTSDEKIYAISYEINKDDDKNIVIYVTNNDGTEEMITAFDAYEFGKVYEFVDGNSRVLQ